jgi:hypothetical protein
MEMYHELVLLVLGMVVISQDNNILSSGCILWGNLTSKSMELFLDMSQVRYHKLLFKLPNFIFMGDISFEVLNESLTAENPCLELSSFDFICSQLACKTNDLEGGCYIIPVVL